MKVAIVGSRGLYIEHLERYLPPGTTEIVSGGAKGIDTCAKMGIEKIQISDPTREIIAYAHSKGLVCNIYHAEKPEKTAKLLDMGADTILTNNMIRIMPAFVDIMRKKDAET